MAGRPQKLDLNDSFLKHVKSLAKLGLSDEQIADQLDIDVTTFYRYKKRSVAFCQAIKEGKSPVDDLVEQTLLNKALGYTVKETKVFCTKAGKIVTHDIERQVPPDTASIIFWLKNRRPQQWRDKIDHEIGGSNNPIQLAYDATRRLKSTNENKEKEDE